MKISTRTIVTVGMFTAVLSVLSILTIPMPTGVPVTLQTFAVALCGYVLGAKRGTASAALYLLIGTVGVPVFAGMTGGPSWLVSYSGGFLWGFLFLAALCGLGVGVVRCFAWHPDLRDLPCAICAASFNSPSWRPRRFRRRFLRYQCRIF